MYYFLSSTDFLDVYNLNCWSDFTAIVSPPIYLHKSIGWKLGITQLDIEQTPLKRDKEHKQIMSKSKYIYIYCDLISSNNVIGQLRSVINYFPILSNSEQDTAIHFTPTVPYYFPINAKIVESIRIYLRDEHDNTPTLRGSCSRCALHIV